MGLIRRMIRFVPTVAAFAIGYYVGTIDSGAYECVFDAHEHERTHRIEHASPLEHTITDGYTIAHDVFAMDREHERGGERYD